MTYLFNFFQIRRTVKRWTQKPGFVFFGTEGVATKNSLSQFILLLGVCLKHCHQEYIARCFAWLSVLLLTPKFTRENLLSGIPWCRDSSSTLSIWPPASLSTRRNPHHSHLTPLLPLSLSLSLKKAEQRRSWPGGRGRRRRLRRLRRTTTALRRRGRPTLGRVTLELAAPRCAALARRPRRSGVCRGVVALRRAEAGAPLVLALGLGVTVVPAAACRFCASGMDAGSPRRPATSMAIKLLLGSSSRLLALSGSGLAPHLAVPPRRHPPPLRPSLPHVSSSFWQYPLIPHKYQAWYLGTKVWYLGTTRYLRYRASGIGRYLVGIKGTRYQVPTGT